MQELFLNFINQFGYLAIAGLVFLECVFPPIPSELILPMAGFLVLQSSMTLPGVIAAATVGAVSGATVFYGVGRLLSRERLMRLMRTRPLRLLGFKPSDVESAISWFERKGQITVLFCRCVPVVRSLISVPAGTARMGLGRFFVYTTIGSTVWNIVLCGIGFAAGNAWEAASEQIAWVCDLITWLILGICVVAAVWWIVRRAIPALREPIAE